MNITGVSNTIFQPFGSDIVSTNSAFSAVTLGSDSFVGSVAFATTASAVITLGSDIFTGSVGFSPILASFVLATAATVLPEDLSLGDVDPGQATASPEDDSPGDIDPNKATVIQ